VYVVGAVRRPGLYRVPQGSRVADAVARAGGVTRKADPAALNLAAPVADGEQVLVPARLPRAVAAAQGAPTPGVPVGPIQLSSATAEQLDSLPGIGPATTELSLSPTSSSDSNARPAQFSAAWAAGRTIVWSATTDELFSRDPSLQ
jgi:SLBB domain